MYFDNLSFNSSPLGSTPRPYGFSALSIVPVDFWRRHFLVYDLNFHKVGSCDLWHGVWHFTPVNSTESFMGFTRDDAIRSWLSCV